MEKQVVQVSVSGLCPISEGIQDGQPSLLSACLSLMEVMSPELCARSPAEMFAAHLMWWIHPTCTGKPLRHGALVHIDLLPFTRDHKSTVHCWAEPHWQQGQPTKAALPQHKPHPMPPHPPLTACDRSITIQQATSKHVHTTILQAECIDAGWLTSGICTSLPGCLPHLHACLLHDLSPHSLLNTLTGVNEA